MSGNFQSMCFGTSSHFIYVRWSLTLILYGNAYFMVPIIYVVVQVTRLLYHYVGVGLVLTPRKY